MGSAHTSSEPDLAAIIERKMTEHWDVDACPCWFCEAGRGLGLAPRAEYLPHNLRAEGTPMNAHTHIWIAYTGGWYCRVCGKTEPVKFR